MTCKKCGGEVTCKKCGGEVFATGVALGRTDARAIGLTKKTKQHRKWRQEEILVKVHEKYPNGAGDIPTAVVCRKTSTPWDSTHRALGRKK
jgi:hypothetical protein